MSLIPAFEIGLWNAWIFVFPVFIIPHLITKRYRSRSGNEEMYQTNKKENKLFAVLMVIVFTALIYSIFSPLRLGTLWFYGGLSINLVGIALAIISTLNFATTPLDKPVTKGIYRISRNPMYFGGLLTYIGTGLACISWIYPILALVFMVVMHTLLISEERFCLEKYGKVCREYMEKTPRWIGIPKPVRSGERR